MDLDLDAADRGRAFPGIDLRRLRYLLMVAEELHFGRAASRLGIAQPPLSQQIKALEKALGVTLLERTSRSVELTAAGGVLVARARSLFEDLGDAVQETIDTAAGVAGVVRLGFVSSAASVIATAVPSFASSSPGIELQLVEGFTSTNVAALHRGDIDVAIVRDGGSVPGLTSCTLLAEPFVAVVPTHHSLASRSAVTAPELADHPFVFYPREAGALAWHRNLAPLLAIDRPPTIVQTGTSWTTIMHLVAAGLGVTVAPVSVAQASPAGVQIVPLEDTGERSLIEALHTTTERRPGPLELVRALTSAAL